MQVRDILIGKAITGVYMISPEATVAELLEQLARHDVGAMVVSTDGIGLDGIVTERDIVRKLRGVPEPTAATVRSIMSVEVHHCAPDLAADALMDLMTQRRVRHVPVLDGTKVVGLVSIGDAVKQRMDSLEFERDQLNSYVQGG